MPIKQLANTSSDASIAITKINKDKGCAQSGRNYAVTCTITDLSGSTTAHIIILK